MNKKEEQIHIERNLKKQEIFSFKKSDKIKTIYETTVEHR
jgi:hypothetical protein